MSPVNHLRWNGLLSALAAMVMAALTLMPITGAQPRPNIIFILADDLGHGDLTCYGGEVPTPNLDRMAREGTRFLQAYAAAPICSPSRAGLLTGQHPARWQITSFLQTKKGNQACEQADFLDPKAPSLPRILQGAGYRTAHVGKWHLGGGRDVTNAPPFAAYGYQVGFGTYESPEPHPDITATNWIWSARDKVKRWDRTGWMVDRTLTFLRENRGQPAFVNLWLDDPHTPWVPTEEVANRPGKKDRKPDLRQVLIEMDRQIGRLLDEIREWDKEGNTLVIFMSDNGPLPTFAQSRTTGYRGSKLSLYEGGIRVPLIAWQPGTVQAGRVDTNTVISALDFFPTFLHFGRASSTSATDGQNMAAALKGESIERKSSLFWEYGRNTNSFAYPGNAENRSPNLAMREGEWKLLCKGDGTGVELYNLTADPKEELNLGNSEADRARKMKAALLAWRKKMP